MSNSSRSRATARVSSAAPRLWPVNQSDRPCPCSSRMVVEQGFPDALQRQAETGMDAAAEGAVDEQGIGIGQPVLEFFRLRAEKRHHHPGRVGRHEQLGVTPACLGAFDEKDIRHAPCGARRRDLLRRRIGQIGGVAQGKGVLRVVPGGVGREMLE